MNRQPTEFRTERANPGRVLLLFSLTDQQKKIKQKESWILMHARITD
jgi:hypothetical protein